MRGCRWSLPRCRRSRELQAPPADFPGGGVSPMAATRPKLSVTVSAGSVRDAWLSSHQSGATTAGSVDFNRTPLYAAMLKQ